MSVLIRGMEMPYGCANCSCMNGAVYDSKGMAHYFCNVDVEGIRGTDVTNEVIAMYEGDAFSFPDFCPLVEVKEPHGRLIAEKTITEIRYHDADGYHIVNGEQLCELEIDADTVIEAEGSETE